MSRASGLDSSGLGGPRPARLFRLGGSDEYGMHHVLAAVLVVVATEAYLLCLALAGGGVAGWVFLLVPALGAIVPHADSLIPLAVWAVLGVAWVVQAPGPFTWWALPAAVAALLVHVTLALVAGAPTVLLWPRATLVRQARRVGVVAGVTAAVAVLSRAVLALDVPGSTVLAAAALLGVAAWVWAGRWRDEGPPPP